MFVPAAALAWILAGRYIVVVAFATLAIPNAGLAGTFFQVHSADHAAAMAASEMVMLPALF